MSKQIILYCMSAILLMACNPEGVKKQDDKASKDPKKDETTIDSNGNVVIDTSLTSDQNGKEAPIVKELPSGVKISWQKRSGKEPLGKYAAVKMNYTGRIVSTEKVFDSNKKSGQPIPVLIGYEMIVKGWDDAMEHLAVGDQATIEIPADQGYGPEGDGIRVPADADLKVEVEVVEEIQPHKVEGVEVYHLTKSRNPDEFFKERDSISFHFIAFNPRGIYFTTYKEKKPFAFRLGAERVLEGVNLGFQEVMPGEKAFIRIPAKYAYGDKGFINQVKPNESVMYFINTVKRL